MPNLDYWLLFTLAVVGIIDAQLERRTGRGIIARVQDFIDRRASRGL